MFSFLKYLSLISGGFLLFLSFSAYASQKENVDPESDLLTGAAEARFAIQYAAEFMAATASLDGEEGSSPVAAGNRGAVSEGASQEGDGPATQATEVYGEGEEDEDEDGGSVLSLSASSAQVPRLTYFFQHDGYDLKSSSLRHLGDKDLYRVFNRLKMPMNYMIPEVLFKKLKENSVSGSLLLERVSFSMNLVCIGSADKLLAYIKELVELTQESSLLKTHQLDIYFACDLMCELANAVHTKLLWRRRVQEAEKNRRKRDRELRVQELLDPKFRRR